MKLMQFFDCHDMPGGCFHKDKINYNDENNLCSKFLRLEQEKGNDSIVMWEFHSMSDEELEEYFYDGCCTVWEWQQHPRDAAKAINKWLRDNGATRKQVLIAHWW